MAAITESEWLAHTQSTEMLGLLRDGASEKDLWLSRSPAAAHLAAHPRRAEPKSRRDAELDIDGKLTAEERFAAARGAAQALPRRLPGLTSGRTAISITRLIPPPSACTRTGCRFARH